MLRNVAVYLLLEIESSESDVARNKSVGCCTRSSLLIGDSVARRSPFALRYSLFFTSVEVTPNGTRIFALIRVVCTTKLSYILFAFFIVAFGLKSRKLEETA